MVTVRRAFGQHVSRDGDYLYCYGGETMKNRKAKMLINKPKDILYSTWMRISNRREGLINFRGEVVSSLRIKLSSKQMQRYRKEWDE